MMKEITLKNIKELETIDFNTVLITDTRHCEFAYYYMAICNTDTYYDWISIDSKENNWKKTTKKEIIKNAEKWLKAGVEKILIANL